MLRAPSPEPATPAAAPSTTAAPEVEVPEADELQSRGPSAQAPAPPDEPAKENDSDPIEESAQDIEESPLVELAPLPTEFNPDATPPPPLPPKDEEDELAFEPHPDPEPEPEPEHQAETNYEDNPELYRSLAVLTQYDDGDDQTGMDVDYEQQPEEVLEPPPETTEVVEETAPEEQPVNEDTAPTEEPGDAGTGANGEHDNTAMDVEQSPDQPGQQEENGDSPMREPSLAPTSPLSDIPDLPQEIDFSEQQPKEPTPPPVKRKPVRADSEVEEGSATKKAKKEPEELGPNVRSARGKLAHYCFPTNKQPPDHESVWTLSSTSSEIWLRHRRRSHHVRSTCTAKLTDRREDLDRCQDPADVQGQVEGHSTNALPPPALWRLGQVRAVCGQAGRRFVSIPPHKSLRVSCAARSVD